VSHQRWINLTRVASVVGFATYAVGILAARPRSPLEGLFNRWVYSSLMVLACVVHLDTVGSLAVDIGHALGLRPDEGEWAFVRQHPLVGERILRASPAFRNVATIVRSTHERWDGGGYPDGLGGDEIPLAARILSVCDAYTAMTSSRPYRVALSEHEALAELERFGGTQFDPNLVALLATRVRERLRARETA